MGTIDRIGSTELVPGTTYYVRTRYRDVYGNLSLPTTATSVVIRYTDQNPGAKVFRSTTNSSHFVAGRWSAFPFHNNGTNGGYDVYGNWTTNIASGTCPYLDGTPTANFFRMPCDGLARVSARMCVGNDGSGKPDAAVYFGLFRIGSSMPGGNASHPLFVAGPVVLREGEAPVAVSSSAYHVGSSSTLLFVNMSAEISAYSGDYLLAGVYPETAANEGIFVCRTASTSSACASYIHIHVLQD